MNHSYLHINATKAKLHFKQWSNKGYAVFCSMGKVVHIGRLAISLTQWIGDVIDNITEVLNLAVEKEVEDCTDELMEQEMLQLIPVVVTNNPAYAGIVNSINKNINCR